MRKISKWLLPALAAMLMVAPTLVATATPVKENPEVVCLAKNIYYEARGEPLHGKKAVAQVTLNRVDSGQFADNICGVVFQPGQFSWTQDKRRKITDWKAWQESLALAKEAFNSGIHGFENFRAMYFHSKDIKPGWKRKVYAKIGNHIFYV